MDDIHFVVETTWEVLLRSLALESLISSSSSFDHTVGTTVKPPHQSHHLLYLQRVSFIQLDFVLDWDAVLCLSSNVGQRPASRKNIFFCYYEKKLWLPHRQILLSCGSNQRCVRPPDLETCRRKVVWTEGIFFRTAVRLRAASLRSSPYAGKPDNDGVGNVNSLMHPSNLLPSTSRAPLTLMPSGAGGNPNWNWFRGWELFYYFLFIKYPTLLLLSLHSSP